MSPEINLNSSIDKNEEEGIDLTEILNICIRRKIIVGGFSVVSFAVSAFYAFSIPKVWEGNFQIVLSNDKNSSQLSSLAGSRLAQLAGISIGGRGTQLKTEVEILKSPSILFQVFEFVRKEKSKGSQESEMKFINWKGALDIELSRDTSVLNITYQDNDKDIILPVLNKISNIYQDYSGKKRRREIELAMNFLKNEIESYREKNLESLRKEEDFAIANDIGIFSIDSKSLVSPTLENNTSFNEGTSYFQPITTNVESLRLKSVNKLRNITFRLERLNRSDNSDEFINSIQNIPIPQLKESQRELKLIENKLAQSLAIFQENDESIRLLKKQKEQYENLIKSSYRKILESEKSIAEAEIKAAERPKGVITRYKELYAQYLLDANTLLGLENQYRFIELEKSKISDPWELITNPTVLYYPVAPEKKKIAFVSTVIGTILGIFTSIVYDRSKNTIYGLSDISSIVDWRIIDKFSSSDINSWTEPLELIEINFRNNLKGNLGVLFLDDFKNEEKELINSTLSRNIKNNSLIISNSLKDIVVCDSIIVICKIGLTSKTHFKKVSHTLNTQEKSIIGLIAIDEK